MSVNHYFNSFAQFLITSFSHQYMVNGVSQVAQWVKNLPAVQETQEIWVHSLGSEDPLEEGMATHSSILAEEYSCLENPMDVEAWQATVHDVTESDTTERLHSVTHSSHEQRLVCYNPWDGKESDMTEMTEHAYTYGE